MEGRLAAAASGDGNDNPLPDFDLNGVLPPGHGVPYRATMSQFIRRFTDSTGRAETMAGILRYRSELRSLGITEGFQWIGGPLLEEPPIGAKPRLYRADIVTFHLLPPHADDDATIGGLLAQREDLVKLGQTSESFRAACHLVALRTHRSDPVRFVKLIAYWASTLAHRPDGVWRGFVEVPLVVREIDDEEAKSELVAAETRMKLEMTE